MGFWDWLTGGVNYQGDVSNENPPSTVGPDIEAGDPHGVDIDSTQTYSRSLPMLHPSPWSGWPGEWSTPNWDMNSRFNQLVDIAWACVDKNASALSAMPVYRIRNGRIAQPMSWQINPDPSIYSSWAEFCKQLFWDFQLGEAFVMEMASYADGSPMRFRVIPPWGMHVEMEGGARRYRLGGPSGPDVTDRVLHIRYQSTTDGARGVGPLEKAGGRVLTAGLLAKYIREIAATGGVPLRTIETEKSLDDAEAQDLISQYLAGLAQTPSAPPVFDSGTKLVDHPFVPPRDLAMLELAQFNEARIAVLLGVPPFFVALPSGGDSMTYANVLALFDFHDRQTLRPMAAQVMTALSYWALPRGQAVELNSDEYSRPSFKERAEAWSKFIEAGVVSAAEVRTYERFQGDSDVSDEAGPTMTVITGGEQ